MEEDTGTEDSVAEDYVVEGSGAEDSVTEDSEAENSVAGVLAVYVPAGFADIGEYVQYVEENGGENIQFLRINGYDCLLYTIPGVNAFHVSMIVEGQDVLEFSFTPVDDEVAFVTEQIMAASIQAA